MNRFFWTFIILFTFQNINAQYTEIINSKRPGFSESPYSVGSDVYQFESGFYAINNNDPSLTARPETFGGELFFRFGKFIEQLEINLNVAYQKDQVKNLNNVISHRYPLEEFNNPNPININTINGISNFRIGVKYLIYQQEYTNKSKEIRSWKARTSFDKKRLIPSVALYGGINTNFLSEDYKKESISFKGAILLQNDFSDRLVVLTNFIVDEISGENLLFSYIVTITYALSPNWSFFVENIGKYQNNFYPKYQFGSGLAYLISPNLQVDASVRSNLVEDYSYTYFSTGVAWRLDKHQDQLIKQKGSGIKQKNKGFFSKLFGKN